MDEFSIGDLRQDEIEAAVGLWEETGLTRPWNDPRADIGLALRTPCSTVLAGRLGEALAATAMVGCDGHRAYVYYVAVAPRYRGRGYGAAMVRACEAWAADRGAPKLSLMVRNENAAAAGFYRAIGYEAADVFVMSRWLDRAD